MLPNVPRKLLTRRPLQTCQGSGVGSIPIGRSIFSIPINHACSRGNRKRLRSFIRRDYFQHEWMGRPPWRDQSLASHPAPKECCSAAIVIALALARLARPLRVLVGVTHAHLG